MGEGDPLSRLHRKTFPKKFEFKRSLCRKKINFKRSFCLREENRYKMAPLSPPPPQENVEFKSSFRALFFKKANFDPFFCLSLLSQKNCFCLRRQILKCNST